ncbi:MAG TPA: NUDIX hydrolase [Polyangiaceae bacterium]|nr:NUDIX hydrolase [Polyangiaceae bacterium]
MSHASYHVMPEWRIPRGAWTLVKDVARHVLRRPVIGVAAAARTSDGRWVLVRRADTGEWALPGGTLEWGETLRDSIARELREEAGVASCTVGKLVGVYSRPDRDPRFHGVTVVVRCEVEPPSLQPVNPLEIVEVGLFATDAVPAALAFGMQDMLADAVRGGDPVVE